METPVTISIGSRHFDSLEQEVYLALWRTYDRLRSLEDEMFVKFDLTAQQYNVLRLLQADHPQPVATLRLVKRLISRAPDITRMLDKLETRGLISRLRSTVDRRTVHVNITAAGLSLLETIDPELADCHDRQLGHLAPAQLKALSGLLKMARAPHESEDSPWK
jgi:DNA-binding MarR family transcriptional regulator